jgi:protein-S-isoprenylcysteine O-methyltransferase Ste14
MEALAQALARRRVTLGFVFAIAVLYFASPSRESLIAGASIGVLGEAIRIWAAGHLEKSREVTTSGPYRFTRHPLYLGSSVMALGIAVGCRSILVAALVFLYMASTIGAAIRTEEAFLRARFGDAYDAYAEARAPHVQRRFSFERAWRNREYRAVIGLIVALLLLVFRAWLAH